MLLNPHIADERPTVVMIPSVRRVLCIPMLFESSLQTVWQGFETEVRMAVWAVARLEHISQRSRLHRCKPYTTDVHKGQS